MSSRIGNPNRLYELMPALYRERDEQEGFPLRDLLRIITEQADIVHQDIQLLWDNFFIETCERWAIPYIGDLVSNNLLHDAGNLKAPDTARDLLGVDLAGPDLRPPNAVRTRADVAKTIYYRRRKGTLPMLEELARDVTGWAAHAVEFFELLIWSQNLNHVRLFSSGCPDLRDPEAVDRLDGPFDFMSHTVDVRYPKQDEGWHNIRNIGFFLWRLRSYPMENVVAREATQPWQYYFSPLGNAAPLFSRLRREGDEAGLAGELHVPGPIRPAAFYKDLLPAATAVPAPDFTEFYGLFQPFSGSGMIHNSNASLVVVRDGVPVPPNQVRCRDLAAWSQPVGNIVGIDVRHGRIAFGTAFVPADRVDVFYHYGFSAELGGGPYRRDRWLVDQAVPALRLTVREGAAAPEFATLMNALAEWATQGRPNTVITIEDSRTYTLTSPLTLADNNFLVIQAADGMRPHIIVTGGELQITGDHSGSEFTLSGLLVEGGLHFTGETHRARLLHTTLVPGRALNEDGTPVATLPSVTVDEAGAAGALINAAFRLHIAFSVTGPIRLPEHADSIVLLDSIVDGLGGTAIAAAGAGDRPGPPGTLERTTIFGRSLFRRLPVASESIFTDTLFAAQQQAGCVRFSYVPPLSVTPQRYRCQPDLEQAMQIEKAQKSGPLTAAQRDEIIAQVQARLVPVFTSIHYGDPGYAQLHLRCSVEIRTGAEDGSEMGVFCHLKQPQRETNLRIRLEEYLPFGLDAGVIYVT
jgi:hypothetical protein